MYALKAINNIAENLEELLDNLTDTNLRSRVSYGSLYAGMAFSNTKTTACHSISYPLTIKYGLNHGIAVSLTLGHMLIKNHNFIVRKDELLSAFGVSHVEEVQEFIAKIFSKAGIKARLRDLGIIKANLPEIADKSFTPGRMDNNPVDLDKQFILSLLESIY